MGRRGLIGRVRLDEQQLLGHPPRRLDRPPRAGIGDRPGEREREPEVAIDPDEVRAAGVAVQHAAGDALLAQDPRGDIVRAIDMHDHRQRQLAREAQLGAKQRLLARVIRGATVEPALADRDDDIARRGDRVGVQRLVVAELRHDLRMDAERDAHARVAAGERDQRRPRAGPDRRHDHAGDACGHSARDRGIAVRVEGGDIEVTVAVDHRDQKYHHAVRFWHRWLEWFDTSEATLARWVRAARDALFGEMPVLAAGVALFAIMSTVPVLLAVVSIYGLIADASQIHQQLRGLETLLPVDVVGFLGDQLERQAARTNGELGLAIAGSVLAAMYSARGTARAMIDALNRAYRVRERRGRLAMLAITIAMAAATLIGLTVLFGVTVALPGILAMVDLDGFGLVHWVRWPILMALIFFALLSLYRFGPSPRPMTKRHLWPGAMIASVLLVLVSVGLSFWVERVATYELFYGAFGSVIVILLWFYLSVIALVIGGFVNAELERSAGAPAPDRSMY